MKDFGGHEQESVQININILSLLMVKSPTYVCAYAYVLVYSPFSANVYTTFYLLT